MKNILKKITVALMTMAITASICTSSAQAYRLTGHNAIDSGKTVIEGYILNAADLYSSAADNGVADVIGYGVMVYNLANGDYESVAESICDDVFGDALFGKNSRLYKTAKLAINAWCDYFEACYNLGVAKEEEYAASINTYYTINVNGCLQLIEAVKKSVIQCGNTISQSTLDGCQRLVNDMADDVRTLRSKSFNKRFKSHKQENASYADTLEALISVIDFNDLYGRCVQYRKDNYYAHFERVEENSCAAAAVTGMILREKGQTVSQKTIMGAAGSAFWNGVEPFFHLDDASSFTVLKGDGSSKLTAIKNSFRNTSAIVKFGDARNYTYILAVNTQSGIKFVETNGTGVMLTATDFAAQKGYSIETFYSKALASWSYL